MRLAPVLALLAATYWAPAAWPLEVPFYAQKKNGCGAASVAMVMHYWGNQKVAPEQVYGALYRPSQKGILLADMKRYLEAMQFRVFTLRGEWADVEAHLSKSRPLIVGLRKTPAAAMHFVVVTAVGDDRVWLNDPTRGKPNRLKRLEFERRWALADRWMLLALPQSQQPPSP